MNEQILGVIKRSIQTKEKLTSTECINKIQEIANEVLASFKRGGKVIIFGNGGSAGDAQHMVGELIGRFKKERKGLPAISLAANTSSLTAISNDYSYDVSFKRQIEALGNPHDIAIGISTSGNSVNVIEAINYAKSHGLKTIALLGSGGGRLAEIADISFVVPSDETPRIQEAHILLIHIICELIEEKVS